MRLHRSRQKQWAFHRQSLHPVFHHAQFQRDDTSDLNRSTEANLPVALAEMQVPNAELGALYVDGEVHFAAARKVFNVTVATVFGAPRHGAGAFAADFFAQVSRGAAGVDVLRLGWEGDFPTRVGEGGDELGFAAVPFGEDGGGGGAAEDAGVNEARKSDMRDVA